MADHDLASEATLCGDSKRTVDANRGAVDVDDLASQEHPPKRSGRGRAAAPGVVARLGHPQEPDQSVRRNGGTSVIDGGVESRQPLRDSNARTERASRPRSTARARTGGVHLAPREHRRLRIPPLGHGARGR